jgi:hypothetical protein
MGDRGRFRMPGCVTRLDRALLGTVAVRTEPRSARCKECLANTNTQNALGTDRADQPVSRNPTGVGDLHAVKDRDEMISRSSSAAGRNPE